MNVNWDDPEQFPEDVPGELHPGDPPLPGTSAGEPVIIINDDPWIRRLTSRRERRKQRIEDFIATSDYRKRIRP